MKKIIIKIKHTLLILLFLAFYNGYSQNCPSSCLLKNKLNLSTGVDDNGVLLSVGSINKQWNLINVAPPSTNGDGTVLIPNSYVIFDNYSTTPTSTLAWNYTAGAAPISALNSSWFYTNNTVATQPWRFNRQFCVCDNSDVKLSGNIRADDGAKVLLKNSIGTILYSFNNPPLGPSNMNPFKIDHLFTTTLSLPAGKYFLEVELINTYASMMGFSLKCDLTNTNTLQKTLLISSDSCCGNANIVSLQKIIDKNCSGKLDDGDEPGASWVYTLSKNGFAKTGSTDANGEVYFYDVPQGTYSLTETPQNGYNAVYPTGGTTTFTIGSQGEIKNIIFLNSKCQPPCPTPLTNTINISTGLNFSGAVGTTGSYDANWVLTKWPLSFGIPNVNPLPVYLIPDSWTGWGDPVLPGSSYLSPLNSTAYSIDNCSLTGDLFSNEFLFSRKFSLTSPTLVNIKLNVKADDAEVVYLDGVVLKKRITGYSWKYDSTIRINLDTLLPAGCHKIELGLVNCGGALMGIDAAGSVSTLNQSNVIGDNCCENRGMITGLKYKDLNKDGVRQPSEPLLSGWVIELRDGANTLITTQTTNTLGQYSFANLAPGNYIVCEQMQSGWMQTQPGGTSSCYTITLGLNEIKKAEFGNIELPCECQQTLNPQLLWASDNPHRNANTLPLRCGETYTDKLDCFKQYMVYIDNPCGEYCSPDTVITTIKYPSGTTTVSYYLLNSAFIANQVGTYTVSIKVKCNGVWCKECIIYFKQTKKCEPPCDNCKVNGKDKVEADLDASSSTSVIKTFPATTTLNTVINLSGGTDTYTQVRVNIVDFQITSDNPACLQCYSASNQWGSMINGSLSGFTPAITSHPSVSVSNGNNNPREIVFTAASPVAIPMPTALNLSLNIPGVSPLSCCCIKVVLYLKITYRNNKCEECSKVVRVGFTECPDGQMNGTTDGGFDKTTGWPQYIMHAPNKQDAQILNMKPATKKLK